MPNLLTRLKISNYRSLADLSVDLRPVNVLFGPNGAGKSSLLETIRFLGDCASRNVEMASSARIYGVGLLYDGAPLDEPVAIRLSTAKVEYEVRLGLSAGRIEPFAGESLYCVAGGEQVIDRKVGSNKASFRDPGLGRSNVVELREPEKLSIGRYLDTHQDPGGVANLDRLLASVRFLAARSPGLSQLKVVGAPAGSESALWSDGRNLWSVLRNVQGHQIADDRYQTIMKFMKESFPLFDGLILEQTGPTSVQGSYLEKGRRHPITGTGMSCGHLQMLLLLAALFSEGPSEPRLVLFDEPETSLHPWAISVWAKAVKLAVEQWNRQVFIATHSPVLVSQFSPAEILAAELVDGRTRLTPLSEMREIEDLLEEYAPGSLYMAEMVAPQSRHAGHRQNGSDAPEQEGD